MRPLTLTLQVWTFVLLHYETRSVVGHAVIAPDARYASVCWARPERPDRRFATVDMWRAVTQAFARHVPAAPLEKDDPIARLLVGDRDARVQYLAAEPIAIARPEDTAALLDAKLRSISGVPIHE